jgi:hypothetical protein
MRCDEAERHVPGGVALGRGWRMKHRNKPHLAGTVGYHWQAQVPDCNVSRWNQAFEYSRATSSAVCHESSKSGCVLSAGDVSFRVGSTHAWILWKNPKNPTHHF